MQAPRFRRNEIRSFRPSTGTVLSATLVLIVALLGGGAANAAQSSGNRLAASAAAPGLVAAYGFGAGSGTTVRDDSANGNEGTISGAAWTGAGKNGPGLKFDGVSDWVTVPDAASLDLTVGMTLEAWVKPTALGSTWRTVLMKEQPGNLAYALYAHGGGAGPSGHIYVAGDRGAASATTLPLRKWTHLATTYDGAALRVYVNGAEVASRAQSGAIETSASPLRLGGNGVWTDWFKGVVDDVRVYSRALTPAEIGTDMATAVSAGAPPASDTQPPTTPSNLVVTASGSSSLTLSWATSSDDVGVAGYGRYLNGGLVSSGAETSYVFAGFSCGTSYTLAVDAFDAAGNRSAKAQVTASTTPCAQPPPGSAGVFISPSGSDANPCTQALPCRSFNRAYRVATPGAMVEVAAGSYGGETMTPDASKTSTTDVVFRPASGAAVTVTGKLYVQAAHFELRDMIVEQLEFPREADDVTIRNVVNHGFWMQGPSNISFIGGEVSCGFCAYHSHMQNGGADAAPPRNILFDGVYFHDWHSVSGEHTECLQILGGDGLTIRNSVFKNCGTGNGGLGATGSLFIGWLGGAGPVTKNVLIENNFFYPSGNPYAIQMSDLENLDLRYNSISQPIIMFNREGSGVGMDFVGNIMRAGACTAENNGVPINWRYNVIQGGTCGATDRNAAAGFIDVNDNLHLAAGAAAINAGDPASYPGRDIDGQTRPGGSAPDAGADEAA